MADIEARVRIITAKRQTLREQLNNMLTLITIDGIPPLTELKLRLEEITELFRSYRELHEELSMLDPENGGLAEMQTIRNDYYQVATRVKDGTDAAISRLETSTPTNFGFANSTMIEKQKIFKLPTITLHSFSGEFNQWLPCIKGFNSKIDNLEDMSDGTKFTYLQGCLKGSAASKIGHLIGDDASYKAAKEILEECYGKRRVLISRYCDAILDIDKQRPQTTEALSKIVDDVRLNLTTLKSLNVIFEPLVVVRLLERALPPKIREDWEKSLNLDILPTLEQIFKFINETVYRISSTSASTEHEPEFSKKRANKLNDKSHKYARNEKTERSFATGQIHNQSQSKCSYCNGDHYIYNCDSFTSSNVKQRWEARKEKDLCRNCLGKIHSTCPSRHRCKICNRFHHTLLHNQSKSSNAENGSKSNPSS